MEIQTEIRYGKWIYYGDSDGEREREREREKWIYMDFTMKVVQASLLWLYSVLAA
jgi:hypothetical protein